MNSKLFEIRDSGTFIPVIATQLTIDNTDIIEADSERYLLGRAGYKSPEKYILLSALDGGECSYDPYNWSNRTRHVAHQYIIDNWTSLRSGQVIDVQFILGETPVPKQSEMIENFFG